MKYYPTRAVLASYSCPGCLSVFSVETDNIGRCLATSQRQSAIIAFNIFRIKWFFVVVVAGVTADMFRAILYLNK